MNSIDSDIYDIILESHDSKSKELQDWLFSEVIPSIRKYGEYNIDEKHKKLLEDKYQEIIAKKKKKLKSMRKKYQKLKSQDRKQIGGTSIDYYRKYLKYKIKYLEFR